MKAQSLLIDLDNINKVYQMGQVQVQALFDIHLCVKHGEYMAILGPSGSGKSTLMNILGCLDSPSSGTYRLDGKEVGYLSRGELAYIRNRQIGFIFQSFNLLEYGTALDNVALPLVYRGVGLHERTQAAMAMLDKVGLADRADHRPNELSGGQRQRVAVARALVTDPDVLLADEPTGNLDSQSGDTVVSMFEELSAQGKTVIVVTHDMQMAKRTNRVVTIKDGRLTEEA